MDRLRQLWQTIDVGTAEAITLGAILMLDLLTGC